MFTENLWASWLPLRKELWRTLQGLYMDKIFICFYLFICWIVCISFLVLFFWLQFPSPTHLWTSLFILQAIVLLFLSLNRNELFCSLFDAKQQEEPADINIFRWSFCAISISYVSETIEIFARRSKWKEWIKFLQDTYHIWSHVNFFPIITMYKCRNNILLNK